MKRLLNMIGLVVLLTRCGAQFPVITQVSFEAYKQNLKGQAKTLLQLPDSFIETFQDDFSYDLRDIRFAEDINTMTGQATTNERTVYCPGTLKISTEVDIKLMLHEMTHVEQYDRYGQMFFQIYLVKSIQSGLSALFSSGELNVSSIHNQMSLEQEAESNAVSTFKAANLLCKNLTFTHKFF